MTVTYLPLANFPVGVVSDTNGRVRAGVSLYVYARGTTTPVQVYSDAGSTPLAQPLVTNSLGLVPGYVASPQSVDVHDPVTGRTVGAEIIAAGDAGGSGSIPGISATGSTQTLGRLNQLQPSLEVGRVAKFDPNQLSAASAATPLTISTPDSTGQVVEPAVEYIPWGWNGYKYWLLVTGYANGNASTENPALYNSNDGLTFTPAAGVPFPIMGAPVGQGVNSHNDDPEIRLGPDGKLHLFWIQYDQTPNSTSVYWCTYDGTTLTSPTVLWSNVNTTEAVIAPVFIYDGVANQWVCWYTDAANFYNSVNAAYTFKRRTCAGQSPGGSWSSATTTTVTGPANLSIWEAHVERRGAQLLMVATWCTIMTGGVGTSLYFGTSDDGGLTWAFGTTPILTASASGWDSGRMYRADFSSLEGTENPFAMWYSACATADGMGNWFMAYTEIQGRRDPSDRLVTASWPPAILGPLASSPGANVLVMCRVFVKKSGTLMAFNYFPTAASGNVLGAVYDTGEASAGNATLLWASSSVGMGAGSWQALGHPRIQVLKGQELYFGIMFSAASTANLGRFSTLTAAAAAQLPAGFLPVPGGLLPKLAATFAAGSFAAPASIPEASLIASVNTPVIIAEVQ